MANNYDDDDGAGTTSCRSAGTRTQLIVLRSVSFDTSSTCCSVIIATISTSTTSTCRPPPSATAAREPCRRCRRPSSWSTTTTRKIATTKTPTSTPVRWSAMARRHQSGRRYRRQRAICRSTTPAESDEINTCIYVIIRDFN